MTRIAYKIVSTLLKHVHSARAKLSHCGEGVTTCLFIGIAVTADAEESTEWRHCLESTFVMFMSLFVTMWGETDMSALRQ